MAIWDKPTQEEFKEMRRRRHERERQWKEEDEARRREKAAQKGPVKGRSAVMPTFDENWENGENGQKNEEICLPGKPATKSGGTGI